MKKENKKLILSVLAVLVLMVVIIGIAFAVFNYTRTGLSNNQILVGKIWLHYTEKGDTLTVYNVFPETKDEATKRNDNVLEFTIDGRNDDLTKDIYYGIYLEPGTIDNTKTPLDPNHVRVQLIETINGVPNTVVDGVTYPDFNKRLIYTNTVLHNTNEEVVRDYKLRLWVDENVLISDTDPNADYMTDEYTNSYVSVKISVKGDFEVK